MRQLRAALAAEWPDAPSGAHGRVVARLCRAAGGERHYLPRRPRGEAAARVVEVLSAGATIDQAACAAGVSVRHARRLRGAFQKDISGLGLSARIVDDRSTFEPIAARSPSLAAPAAAGRGRGPKPETAVD